MTRWVYILSGLQAAILAALWLSTYAGGMDNMSRGMSRGYILMFGSVAAVFVVPAVVMALLGKAPQVAVWLAATPLILFALLTLRAF